MKNRRESILIIEKYYNTSLSLSQKKKGKIKMQERCANLYTKMYG